MAETPTPEARAVRRAARTTAIAEAIGVSKRYGATVALSDVSLRVMPGESHALVGRNGAGKSTLVGILTGPARARQRRNPLRRRTGAADRRSRRAGGAASPASTSIRPSFPSYRRREPVHQPPAACGAASSTGRALRREAREVLDRWNVVGLGAMRAPAISGSRRGSSSRSHARSLTARGSSFLTSRPRSSTAKRSSACSRRCGGCRRKA